jgi:hypothetical protein
MRKVLRPPLLTLSDRQQPQARCGLVLYELMRACAHRFVHSKAFSQKD